MKKITVFIILCFTLVINVSADKFVSVKFARCIDGDTAAFILNDEEIRVRFLAIDTPEIYPKNNIKPFGIEASDYTCTKITRAKVIKLEYDPKSDLKDQYGRYLAWIWVDNSLLQKELISLGYAKVAYIYGEYKYLEDLNKLEKDAINNNLGIWREYTVTFVYNNKTKLIKVKPGETIEKFIPRKKGYKFIHWQFNNNKFDFDTKIESDIILNAKFKINDSILTIIYITILITVLILFIKIKSIKRFKNDYNNT